MRRAPTTDDNRCQIEARDHRGENGGIERNIFAVEAGTVVVNPLYFQEEDNGV